MVPRFASGGAATYLHLVSARRIVQLVVLISLAIAPFGRIGVSQAMIGHAPMPAHCAGQPMSDPGRGHLMAVDCMIACAAIAPTPAAQDFARPCIAQGSHPARPDVFDAGLHTGADPPPPRIA